MMWSTVLESVLAAVRGEFEIQAMTVREEPVYSEKFVKSMIVGTIDVIMRSERPMEMLKFCLVRVSKEIEESE